MGDSAQKNAVPDSQKSTGQSMSYVSFTLCMYHSTC